MDPEALATAVTTLLTPFLAKAGAAMADEAVKNIPQAVGNLWKAVSERFRGNPAAEGAASDLSAKAEDEENREAFSLQLKKMIRDDPSFADEVSRLFEAAGGDENILQGGTGSVATRGGVAAGESGIALKVGKNSRVDINVFPNRDISETKNLASSEGGVTGKISRQPSGAGTSKDLMEASVMQVSRQQLEQLRLVQYELDAYVRGYVAFGREVPLLIEKAHEELKRWRDNSMQKQIPSEDDWEEIRQALRMLTDFSLDLKALKSDTASKKHQGEFSTDLEAALREIEEVGSLPKDPEEVGDVLRKAITHVANADVMLQHINEDCHKGATSKLTEIKILLDQVFKPYELSKGARLRTERKATKDRSANLPAATAKLGG